MVGRGVFLIWEGRCGRGGLGLSEVEAPFAAFFLQGLLLVFPQFLKEAFDFRPRGPSLILLIS